MSVVPLSASAAVYTSGTLTLGDETLLWGHLPLWAQGKLNLLRQGKSVNTAGVVGLTREGGRYYLLAVRDKRFSDADKTLELQTEGRSSSFILGPVTNEEGLLQWMSLLPVEERETLFRFLTREVLPSHAASPMARQLAIGGIHALEENGLELSLACWAAPHVLYCEGTITTAWPGPDLEMVVVSSSGCERVNTRFFQIEDGKFAAVAVFPGERYRAPYEEFHLCLLTSSRCHAFNHKASRRVFGLAFVDLLQGRPAHQLHRIREMIASAVLDASKIPGGEGTREHSRALLNTLQHFISVPSNSFTEARFPYNIHMERVLPIGEEGVALSGWMRDPHQLLEEIELVFALGFSLRCTPAQWWRYDRPDVAQSYSTSAYGAHQEKHGFFLYMPYPDEVRQRLNGLAVPQVLRLIVRLKDGSALELTPEGWFGEDFAQREFLLKGLPVSEAITDDVLIGSLYPALAAVQKRCMEQVKLAQVHDLRAQKTHATPEVSIIIPLYRQLDFLKPQCATLAQEREAREGEIIFVLDSPEQEAETLAILRPLVQLYRLPVKLAVMNRNGGYSAANNAGVTAATGEYLLLMNSDVFPQGTGWLAPLLKAAKQPGIGPVAPRLLYEDESLQHAGMYFMRESEGPWLNRHYYKGYPAGHAAAQRSSIVPAVTAACLMLPRALFEKVGGFTTGYVIGDFEDSDLCLKCREEGAASWYEASSVLYHLERQSVPLHEGYNGGLAWRYNAWQHTRRWGPVISTLMAAMDVHREKEAA